MTKDQFDEALKELSTLGDMLRWASSRFNEAHLHYGHGTDNAWDEALAIILPTLHLSYDIKPELLQAKLLSSEKQKIMNLLEARINKHIPAPYLIHEAWFAGSSFYVDERVLIPRSPVNELIENRFAPWIAEENVHRILDLCTGSGCIAIACALQFEGAQVDGVDLESSALEVAKINQERYSVQEQVQFRQGDLFEPVMGQRYDIIVSNPPYVSKEDMMNLPLEYKHEPQKALAAGQDGLEIVSRILKEAVHYLNPEGILIVEVGNSMEALIEAYPSVPFTWLEFTRSEDGVFLLTREQLEELPKMIGA